MAIIYLADDHDQVLYAWRKRGDRNLKVAHLDFHCDMRGFLVDRNRGLIVRGSDRDTGSVDIGNFLGHAVLEGIVTDLVWVYDKKGGRRNDSGGVVTFESDLTAPFKFWHYRRIASRVSRVTFRQELLQLWNGLRPGEQLDLDWDMLASIEYDRCHMNALVEQFLSRDFRTTPEVTFFIYSPDYSQGDRSEYEEFAERLATKFNASIERLPPSEIGGARFVNGDQESSKLDFRARVRNKVPASILQTKRKVSRAIRQYDTKRDVY